MRHIRAFTLVELLIVIAILAILAAAVVIVINPGELMAQAKDSERATEIKSIGKAIDLFILDNSSTSLGSPNTVYISIPSATAPNCDAANLSPLPAGWSYRCASSANLRNIDGTGWIPINFSLIKSGSPLSSLPVDPVNDVSLFKYYSFTIDSSGFKYKIQSGIESVRYAANAGSDGGIDPSSIELGTALNNAPFINGIIGLWKFEEGSGASTVDSSGFSNALSWSGNGTHYISGKVGYSGQFNGTDDYAQGTLSTSNQFTVTALIRPNQLGREQHIADYTSTQFYFGSSNALGTTSWSTAAGTTAMTTGNWYHVAVVRNSQGIQLYLNGQKNGAEGTLGNNPSSPFVIGDFAPHSGSYKFNGLIDEVTVYKRALSPGEIMASYLQTK